MKINLKLAYLVFTVLIFTSCQEDETLVTENETNIDKAVLENIKVASEIIRINAKLLRLNQRVASTSLADYEAPIIKEISLQRDADWEPNYYEITSNLSLDEDQPAISKLTKVSNIVYDENEVINIEETLNNFDIKELISNNSNSVIVNQKISDLIQRIKTYAVSESENIIDSEELDNDDLKNKIIGIISTFEDEVVNTRMLLSDKEDIFATTSALLINMDEILLSTTSLTEITDVDNIAQRMGGKFWKKIGEFLKRVAATVVYVAVAAAGLVGGLVGGFLLCGPYCAAAGGVGGLILGHYLGSKLAYLISEDGPF